MSIATDKARLDAAKTNLKTFLEDNSVTVPVGAKIDGMVELLADIKTDSGVEFGGFTVSGYEGPYGQEYYLPLAIGMTWGEWVSSTLNLVLDISGGGRVKASVGSDSYIYFMFSGSTQYPVSVDGTSEGQVKAGDVIVADFTYLPYYGSFCCFSAGTQVLVTMDGDTAFIENVNVGDKVVSYDITTGTNYIAEVRAININERTTDIAEVYFDNGSMVTMNAYHPLYTENGFHSITRYNGYDELVVGDVVKTADGWAAITNINRYTSDPIITYNLDIRDAGEDPDVDTNDTYYANGIVVKNGFC